MADKLPSSERQARPLTRIAEPERQREVWQRAVETAPDGVVTAAHVKETVKTFEQERKKAHVAHSSGNNEWYTPPEYIAAARQTMGSIDLDPASSDIANQTVRATKYHTVEDDGLAWDWYGRVWMNPPYASNLIGDFTEKLAMHIKLGHVTQACILVNNATETGWFNALLDVAACVCFVRGRIKFIDQQGNPSGAPLQGQAVLYIGSEVDAFSQAFSKFGRVLYAG